MPDTRITTISLEKPFSIGKMGTSGLRQTQDVYNQPGFLEQFTEGIALFFAELASRSTAAKNNTSLVIGGDPRKGNRERIEIMIRILTAHGFKIYRAREGLASTPAMSHAIRHLRADGGIILTASHNPFTDVGIKLNMADGSPALDDTVIRVHELQNNVSSYKIASANYPADKDMVTDIDIIGMYADLLDSIFNFQEMRALIKARTIKGAFDSMHGAAGPFATEIFTRRLGMDALMIRHEPREDLGGYDQEGHPCHPEPDFDYIAELIQLNHSGEYHLVAAWDSDVDRRLDGGSDFFLESADEFAIFSRYSDLINLTSLFPQGIYFCRSTVTASTIDIMEPFLNTAYPGSRTVETPTGFKWIAELGNWGVEESNGVGNPYLREKDGIFATVFLLKIMLKTGQTPRELMEETWREFGRVYFTRGEISGSDIDEMKLLTSILDNASKSSGKKFGDLILESAEIWDYRHPATGTIVSRNAAWVLRFSNGNSVKARFSGTGSGGYTLRIYCSKFDHVYNSPKSGITLPMKNAFNAFLADNGFIGQGNKFTDTNQPDPYA